MLVGTRQRIAEAASLHIQRSRVNELVIKYYDCDKKATFTEGLRRKFKRRREVRREMRVDTVADKGEV